MQASGTVEVAIVVSQRHEEFQLRDTWTLGNRDSELAVKSIARAPYFDNRRTTCRYNNKKE